MKQVVIIVLVTYAAIYLARHTPGLSTLVFPDNSQFQ